MVVSTRTRAVRGRALDVSCVLRKNTQGIRTFQAYAGHFTELEFFREGESITGGIDASAQELEMKEGTVLVDKLQWTPEFLEVCGIESAAIRCVPL